MAKVILLFCIFIIIMFIIFIILPFLTNFRHYILHYLFFYHYYAVQRFIKEFYIRTIEDENYPNNKLERFWFKYGWLILKPIKFRNREDADAQFIKLIDKALMYYSKLERFYWNKRDNPYIEYARKLQVLKKAIQE